MTAPPNAQLTHVGLYVDDMESMVRFYTELIGLVVTDSGEFLGRQLTFLSRRADEHHQLVLVTGRRADDDVQILSQLSFRVDDLSALKHFHRRALELGATAMEGRNHGNSWSIYFLDPETNRIEIYTPTPWYVSQPWRVALDLSQSNEQIEATTLALIEQSATWGPVESWRTELAARLAGLEDATR
jgi:catechol 2,3-dioxygenase